MAAVLSKLAAIIGAQNLEGTLLRLGLTGIGSAAVTQLIPAIQADKTSSDPTARSNAHKVPQYAIVDLHNDKIVKTLSTAHVYSILTHRRRIKRSPRAAKVTLLREGERLVSVK